MVLRWMCCDNFEYSMNDARDDTADMLEQTKISTQVQCKDAWVMYQYLRTTFHTWDNMLCLSFEYSVISTWEIMLCHALENWLEGLKLPCIVLMHSQAAWFRATAGCSLALSFSLMPLLRGAAVVRQCAGPLDTEQVLGFLWSMLRIPFCRLFLPRLLF